MKNTRIIPEQEIKEVSPKLYDAVIRRVSQCNDSDPVIVDLSVSFDKKACIENSLPIATVRLYSEDLGQGWTIFQLHRAIAVIDDIAINVDTVQQVDITSHDIERMHAMPQLVNLRSPHF